MSEEVIEKVFFLEGVDLFSASSLDDLAAIAAIAHEQRWNAGDALFKQGESGDALIVIVEGRVRIEKDGRKLLEFGPKDSLGETSFIDGKGRPVTAIAETPVSALVVDRQDFMDLVSDRVELLKGLFVTLSKHLRAALDAAVRTQEKAAAGG